MNRHIQATILPEGVERDVCITAEAAVKEASANGWAKVIGDWRDAGGLSANFAYEELALAVKQVHESGGRIAVHAIIRESLEMAIEAGADSIEHGLAVDPGHARA